MRPILISAPIILLTLFLSGCFHVPVQPPAPPPTNGGSDATTSTTDIDTSDWQTYTNEEYGFGFRYPREWGVEVSTDQDRINIIGPNPYCEKSVCSKLYLEVTLLDILVTTSSLDKFLAEHREALAEPLKDSVSERANDYKKIYKPLPGFTGTLVTDIGIFEIFYYFNLNDSHSLYITQFDADPETLETLEIFPNIINSIRVIH